MATFSVSPTTLFESEGTVATFNFDLTGESLPAVVTLAGNVAQSFTQFNLFSLSFSGLAGAPVDSSPNMDFSQFDLTIVEPVASITVPIFNDFIPEDPQDVTFSVTSSDVSFDPGASSTVVTFADEPVAPPPPPPTIPEVSVTGSPTTLVEEDQDIFTLSFTVSEPVSDPVLVTLESGVPESLAEFEVFSPLVSFNNLQLVSANPDASGLTLAILDQNASVSLPLFDDTVDEGPETFTYTLQPSADYTIGTGEVTFTINDNDGPPPPPPNTDPEASNDSYSTDFETALTINAANGVLSNDSDADGDDLTAGNASDPDNGSVALNDNGSFTYTPDVGFSGDDSFTYTVDDGNGGTDTATVTVTVEDAPPPPPPENIAPDAVDDSYSTEFETALTINAANGVLSNDSDADGDALTAAIDADPINGSVTLNDDGSFSYTPDAGFSGEDAFSYTVSDGEDTDTATVTVTVDEDDTPPPPPPPENIAPDATDDAGTTPFNTPVSINVLGNDSDADNGPSPLSIDSFDSSSANGGTVAFNPDGTAVYTPADGFSGTDTFSYTVTDGEDTDTATVTVTVDEDDTPPPPPPPEPLVVSLSATPTDLVEEEGTLTTLTFNLSEAPPAGGVNVTVDSDIPASLAEFDVNVASFSGLQLVTANADSSGFTVNITEQVATIELPVFDDDLDEGLEEITYSLQTSGEFDIDPAASSITLSITDDDEIVVPPNTAPVADDDSYTTTADTPLTVSAADGVLTNDTDAEGDALVATFVGNPSNGSVELEEDGSFTYTPDAGFVGTDSFTYQANDGLENSEVATVTVTVEDDAPPPPEDPVVSFTATPDSLNEAEGTPISFDFTVTGDFPEEGIIIRTDENFFPNTQLDFNLLDFENPEVINGIEFFDFEEIATGRFLIDWRLTQPEAFIRVAVFDDNLAEPDTSFTTGLLPGEGYTLDPEATSATIFVTDGVDGTGGPVVSLAVDQTEVNEGDPLTITLTAEGDLPEGGLEVFVDSDIVGAIGEFITVDEEGNPIVTFEGLAGFPAPNEDGSGFTVIMTDNTATINFDVFDDGPGEGSESFEFSVLDGENYDVSADAGSVTVTIDDGGMIEEPVVSFSTTPEIISEAEGTSLVLDFSVAGEIPEGGITVNLEGDTAEILQQFLAPDGDGAVQTRVTAEGNVLYRFDTSFEADNSNFGNIEGGILEVFALEDGDPAEDNSDPAAAGTGFLSDFSFTITEPTASITLPVLDDLIAEPDQTFTYTLVDGDGYEVDGETNSGTFTVTDGVDDGVGPVVGVTAEPTTLIESDQTRIELEFTADGEIPEEGLVVVLEGDVPRAIAEFDVTASNPRDPEDEIEIEGPIITGGNIVGTDETASSLVFRMTENTATLSVPVFEDQTVEGTETINFNLLDGELYEVDENASSVAVTIEDGELPPAVVSLSVEPTLVAEDSENPSLTLTFNVDGEIPEGGLSVLFDGSDVNPLFEQITGGPIIEGFALGEFFDPEQPDLLEFVLLENTSSVTLNILDDVIEEEPQDFRFAILPDTAGLLDSDYAVLGGANSATVTLVDGDSVIPGSGPTVNLSVDNTDLEEGDEFTVNFDVDGELPEGGITVLVDSETPRVLGEFDLFDEEGNPLFATSGIEGVPSVGDGGASSFLVTIVEPEASLTLSVFDDGANEGLEEFSFSVVNGETYEIDPETSTVSLSINDFETLGTPEADEIVGDDMDNSIDAMAGDDLVAGGLGDDVILGNDGDDVLRGDANSRASSTGMGGNDIIFGGNGNDRIGGKDGNDLLSGDEGDDMIFGDDGDDTIMGVTGNDILTGDDFSGGSGSDLFIFGNGDGTDTITDFDPSEDLIGLVEGELMFEDIEIIDMGGNAAISVMETGETLAVLNGVSSDELTADTFVITPDVSSLNDLV